MLSKKHLSLGIAMSSALLAACGDKNGSSNWEDAVGLYQSTNEKMVSADHKNFIVTSDGSIYTLRAEESFKRYYKADVQETSFSYKDGKFSSGDIEGNKISSSTAPESLRLLARLNEKTVTLRKALKAAGIGFQLRLEATSPSFTDVQEKWIDQLSKDPSPVIAYLKAHSLNAFWINDYTEETSLYIKAKHLCLPAGVTDDPTNALSGLSAGTLTVSSKLPTY